MATAWWQRVSAKVQKQHKDQCRDWMREESAAEVASLAVPRQGHVLSTVAKMYGEPLRKAVSALSQTLGATASAELHRRLFARRRREPSGCEARPADQLCAWMTVAAWAAGVGSGSLSEDAGLADAEKWFLGTVGASCWVTALVPAGVVAEVNALLRAAANRKALSDLLPYVLDPHGEGSRLSVRARPETADARSRKRAEGVFYTPADVADYMAAQVVRGLKDDAVPLTVFDPACGTGVFLRAVLAELRRRNPSSDSFDIACSSLYGTDIDSWALDACAFVLLLDCMASVRSRGIAPIAAWHALRLNLTHLNALRLEPGQAITHDNDERLARLHCRSLLKAGTLPEAHGTDIQSETVRFHDVFPEIAEGARVIIGNPPYADIGDRNNLMSLSTRFETLRAAPRETADVYPLFVEQMIRLTAPNAHGGAMVLPLSIACNTSKQFLALRSLIARTEGQWRFAFFDREPHALFGEDVKTRNAIVLWTRESSQSSVSICTGRLRKWRGHSRKRMLTSIRFTEINADIRLGIPKVEGKFQAAAMSRLLHERRSLRYVVTHVGRATLAEALRGSDAAVYVGSTAYNFLNCFLRPSLVPLAPNEQLSENPLLVLQCPSREAAFEVFAVLSSRLAFWWWHAHGDGFHVTRHNIESIPIGRAISESRFSARLARLGEAVWNEVSVAPVVSRNKGRTSLGYSSATRAERDRIDALLIEALGLSGAFAAELANFCESVTAARISECPEETDQLEEASP